MTVSRREILAGACILQVPSEANTVPGGDLGIEKGHLPFNGGIKWVERFSGDGLKTEFPLSCYRDTKEGVSVYIYGVLVSHDRYTATGGTLKFSEAPPRGTDNIEFLTGANCCQQSCLNYKRSAPGAVIISTKRKFDEAVSVADFGAVGNGVVDDSEAIQLAVDYACNQGRLGLGTPRVDFPSGVYRVSRSIEIRWTIRLTGIGFPLLHAAHDGDVLRIAGIPERNLFPDNKVVIDSLTFKSAKSSSLASFVRVGGVDGNPITYVSSANDVEINNCSFQSCSARYVIDCSRGFGLTLRGCIFTAISARAVLKLRQSPDEIPFWTYAVNVHSCDFTGISGKAIEADGGDLTVFGGIIQGCALGAVDVGISATYLGTQPVCFYGTYFEANSEFHFRARNARVLPSFYSCKFVKGAASGNALYFASGTQAAFYGCTSPNNSPRIHGGNVRQYGCSYMSQNLGQLDSFSSDKQTISTSEPTIPTKFGEQLRVNGGAGGGAALIMCSHSKHGSLECRAELFFVSLGVRGNKFIIDSVKGIGGGEPTTFSFSVDSDGVLQVETSDSGNAKYHVIAQSNAVYLP